MKSPEAMYALKRKLADGDKHFVEKHLANEKYDEALNVLKGYQWGLIFIALLQIRWSIDGVERTMGELDQTLHLFDKVFRGEWSSYACRLGALECLNRITGREPCSDDYYEPWSEANGGGAWGCAHSYEVFITAFLRGRDPEPPQCGFPDNANYRLHASTYKNYVDLVLAIGRGDGSAANECLSVGESYYTKRSTEDAGPAFEGGGQRNEYVFDFRLAAIYVTGARSKGLDLRIGEPYASILA